MQREKARAIGAYVFKLNDIRDTKSPLGFLILGAVGSKGEKGVN